MSLLSTIKNYSVCPVCDAKLLPGLDVHYNNSGSVHYTYVDGDEYPLVFSKHLEYGNFPLRVMISSDDVLQSADVYQISNIALRGECKDHYSYNLINISSGRTRGLQNIVLYPSICEVAIVGNYKVINNANPSHYMPYRSAVEKRVPDRMHSTRGKLYRYENILSFNKLVPMNNWNMKDIKLFEEKVNKLLLLK